MTVTLAYVDASGYVDITADGFINGVTQVTIERSTNQIAWTTVRGGADMTVPLGGLRLPKIAGSYASTPDVAALDIVGDLDIRVDLKLDNYASGLAQSLVTKWGNAGSRSYALYVTGAGLVQLAWSADGTASLSALSTVPITPTASGRIAIRCTLDVNNGAAGRTITFSTASHMDGGFTQLGAPVVQAGVTSIFSGAAPVEVGGHTAGTVDIFAGTVYAAQIRNGIGSTIVANPVFWDEPPTGTTNFTDSVGRVWTIHGTATVTYRELNLHDYEFTTHVQNFYRVSADPPGLYATGDSGDYASTPDTALLDITGDLTLRVDATLDAWVSGTPSGANDYLVGKYDSSINQRSYVLRLSTTGQVQLLWSTDGTAVQTRTATAMPIPVDGRLALRADLDVDNGAAGHTVTFYTAPTIDGPWTQLGDPVITAGVTSVFAGSAALIVSGIDGGSNGLTPGVFHAAEVQNVATSTTVANPRFDLQANGAASFTDGVGRLWTINGNADIATSQSANITPAITGAWIKSVTRPFLNIFVPGGCAAVGDNATELLVSDSGVNRPARAGVYPIVNRTYAVASTDIRTGRDWMLRMRTHTHVATTGLDYLLSSGDIILIQVPPDCDQVIPHGYVVAYDASYVRPHRRRPVVAVWDIPVQEVAPPGPDIVYAELTWQTVLNAYATWADVIAAHPTWADLLTLLPDPSEVIVP